MRVRTLLLLLLILLPAGVVPPVSAQRTYESHLRLNLYSPCTLKLEYEYTKNVTVGDVSSMGPSLYEVTHSPIEFRFEASDIDTYAFTLQLAYEVRTIQTMKLTVFSGSQPPSTIEMPAEAANVTLYFEVTVHKEPSYPTVEEITENLITHMTGQLEIYHADNQRTFRLISQGLTNYSYLVALVVVALIILIFLVYRSLGREANAGSRS